MSDTTQRRGTDYDSLRNLGAPAGRSPREAEDPLAELARLVSQGDSYAAPQEPRDSYAQPPRGYAAPVVDRHQDRLDPAAPAAPRQSDFDPRAYGAASRPDYDPNDDFFAEPAASAHSGYGATYQDEFDDGLGAPSRAYADSFDDPDAGYPPYDDGLTGQDLPVRSRRGLVLAAVAGLVVLGGVGAWATGMMGSDDVADGAPPVIKAESEPVKVVAEAKPVVQQKQSYDRIPVNADANVVASAEEPGEKPAPRVILPGAASGPTETRVGELAADPSVLPEQANDPNAGRRVRTIAIRPDGSAAPAADAPQLAAAPQQPEPIRGTGVAEGMSMQPGNDFGIMSSEAPQPQASAGPDVPMPEPRPSGMAQGFAAQPAPIMVPETQARAATAAPAPAAPRNVGPPSSPQPQVEITNKRPLRGTPGPSSQNTVPPASTAAPRQVAMAGADPASLAPAATPAQARPQVAALSTSSGGFGVQLTAQRSEAEALSAFGALKQRHPGVLGSYNAVVARADLGGDRGVFYRAMVPASSQAEASNLCIQFKASGVDCIVQRR